MCAPTSVQRRRSKALPEACTLRDSQQFRSIIISLRGKHFASAYPPACAADSSPPVRAENASTIIL